MSDKGDALDDLFVIVNEQYARWDEGESVGWGAIKQACEKMVDALNIRKTPNHEQKEFQFNLKQSDRGLREDFGNGDVTIDVAFTRDFAESDVEEEYNVTISNLAYIDKDTKNNVYYVEGDKRDLYYFLYDFVDMEHDQIYETYPGLFEGAYAADDMYE